MTVSHYRNVIVLLCFVILNSCASTTPAKWARNFAEQAYCGMSVAEVERITKRRVVKMDNSSPEKGTHYVGSDTSATRMFLAFDSNKLKWYEIGKIYRLMAVKNYPKVELCETTTSFKRNISMNGKRNGQP